MLKIWMDFWEGEVSADDYRPFRIAIGLMQALAFCTLWPLAWLHFDTQGLAARTVQATLGGIHLPVFDNLTGVWVHVVMATGVVGSLMLAAGVLPRLGCLIAYLVSIGLGHRSAYWMDGSDCLLRCMLFFLLLAPLSKEKIPVWPLRFCQLQIAVMYLATAIWKTKGEDWHLGTALYWGWSDPRYMRFPTHELVATWVGQALSSASTWGTLVLEYVLPFMFFWRKTLRPALVLGILLHIGILATMRVGLFTPVVLASYLAFWPELKKLSARVA